ncbi:MAG: NUDIX hydrolase [Chloroflexota bacterium]
MSESYKDLFEETVWSNGPTTVQFEAGNPPDSRLISNINAVPFTSDGRWVVIRLDNGLWEIPGGTIEIGEEPLVALRRELMEEAGASLVSTRYIGAWRMHSQAEKPYRPHLPHPVTYRVVYLCEVTLESTPQLPLEGGEQVVAVEALKLEDVIACFEQIDRFDLAELYRYAVSIVRQ